MEEKKSIIDANKHITQKEKVHSESNVYDSTVNKANSMINEAFYHETRSKSGISPALLLNNAPLVDTDDKYIEQNEER